VQLALGLAAAEAATSAWQEQGEHALAFSLALVVMRWTRRRITIQPTGSLRKKPRLAGAHAGGRICAAAFARVSKPEALTTALLHRLLLLARARPDALGGEAQHARLRAAALHQLSSDSRAVTLLPLIDPPPATRTARPADMAAELKRAPSLAGVMEELGYVCSQGEAAIDEVLAQFDGRLDEATVAEVLAMMARTHAGLDDPHGAQASLAAALGGLALGPADEPPAGAPQQTWNAEAVVGALAAAAPGLNWREVAERLDCPGFDLPDGAAFVMLMQARARGRPCPSFLSPWPPAARAARAGRVPQSKSRRRVSAS